MDSSITTNRKRNVLVIGGTLFIGRWLVEHLLAGGHKVTILHRHAGHGYGPEVEELLADRNDAASFESAVQGREFDVVFDNVYDWRSGTTAGQVEKCASAFPRLERYVFVSSIAAFGSGLDHEEDDELAPPDHPESYVRNKASSERALFRMFRENGFPATTIRPPFLYGPANPFYREAFFWDRMRDGRPIIVPDDGSRLMQMVFVKDLAQAMTAAAFTSGAAGEGFHIAGWPPVRQIDLVKALGRAAGIAPDVRFVPRERIQAAGGNVMGPEHLYFAAYYDVHSITMKIGKAQRLLRFEPTPLDAGLKQTYDWYVQNHAPDRSNYPFEDKLLQLSDGPAH